MLNVVLFEPEIPPNTGNIIRLCANTGAALHLIEPLGFELDDKRLRRAGLDYHEFASVARHPSLEAYLATSPSGQVWACSTRGSQRYDQVRFTPGDSLLFGPESRGLPGEVLDGLGADHVLRIPMQPQSRSLNLSNAVSVVLFEAWRQLDFQ